MYSATSTRIVSFFFSDLVVSRPPFSDCGTQLRKEDPATLKDIIATIQTRTKPLLVAEDAAALSGGNGKSEVMSLAAKFQVWRNLTVVVCFGFAGFSARSHLSLVSHTIESHCFTNKSFLNSIRLFPLERTNFDYLFALTVIKHIVYFVHTVQVGLLLLVRRTNRTRRLGLLPRARHARHDLRPQKQQTARGRRGRDAAAAAKVAGEPRPPQPCVSRVWERDNPRGGGGGWWVGGSLGVFVGGGGGAR
jgi:hypothetical protein